jgi:hypothetical protein
MIEEFFEYAYPLYVMAKTRHEACADPFRPVSEGTGTVRHQRQLSDHTSRWITTPNNDTLYSTAWLDLAHGPVDIHLARMPQGRYWSLAFLDAFTNNFAVVGSRQWGTGPVRLRLVRSDVESTIDGASIITAPGNDVWLFARFLVDGPDDLGQARRMQDGLQVLAPKACSTPARPVPTQATDAANFLAVVNDSLARNPGPALDAPRLRAWSAIGVCPGNVETWATLGAPVRHAWQSRIDVCLARLAASGGAHRSMVQGWVTSGAEIGDFGQNHALRASVAHGGLGALPPSEAIYFVRFADEDGRPLDGRHRYTLRVPPCGIPVDAFWSLSMYEAIEGRRHFVPNPIGRHSIGNRTTGLVNNPDGSIDICLQHSTPASPASLANWLPAPEGNFQIALRAYLPRAALQEGACDMPSIRRYDPYT